MGLWDFIKRLFTVALAFAWRKVAEAFRPKTKPRANPSDHPYRYVPGLGRARTASSPVYRGFRGLADNTRRPFYRNQPRLPDSIDAVYTDAYPKNYIRDAPSDDLTFYRRPSPYKSSLDELYQNRGLVYDRRKFKYRTKISEYK
jgi:hypothetical protein